MDAAQVVKGETQIDEVRTIAVSRTLIYLVEDSSYGAIHLHTMNLRRGCACPFSQMHEFSLEYHTRSSASWQVVLISSFFLSENLKLLSLGKS